MPRVPVRAHLALGYRMKTLVLDKSAVKAAPRGLLKSLRTKFDFLLSDTLLHEIATEKLDQRSSFSEIERADLDRKIRANFLRTIEEAGNLWIDNEAALLWEIEQGCSAKHAPRISLRVTPSIDMLSEAEKQFCLDDDARKGELASVVHAREDQQGFQEIRSWGEKKVFCQLREDYSSERVHNQVARDAKRGFAEIALQRGLKVSPDFTPGPDWFSFGITLASQAYLPWKFWKHGDGLADRRKPPNPYFDMVYVGYVAVADGILSTDKDLLKLAWACWPEKTGDIYELDMKSHRIGVFKPRWSS